MAWSSFSTPLDAREPALTPHHRTPDRTVRCSATILPSCGLAAILAVQPSHVEVVGKHPGDHATTFHIRPSRAIGRITNRNPIDPLYLRALPPERAPEQALRTRTQLKTFSRGPRFDQGAGLLVAPRVERQRDHQGQRERKQFVHTCLSTPSAENEADLGSHARACNQACFSDPRTPVFVGEGTIRLLHQWADAFGDGGRMGTVWLMPVMVRSVWAMLAGSTTSVRRREPWT